MRRTACVVVIMVAMLASLAASPVSGQTTDAATPSAQASPPPAIGIGGILPTEDQVPDGLVIIEDGERTLRDVTSGFTDPEKATEMFVDWGWERNVIRAFHTPEAARSDANEIDGIYVSIHEFGSPEAAAEALDYSVDVHKNDTNLTEQSHPSLGDASRILFGEQPYGKEITIYVQQGSVLIRLSASSPEGDPTEDAIALIKQMLEAPYFER